MQLVERLKSINLEIDYEGDIQNLVREIKLIERELEEIGRIKTPSIPWKINKNQKSKRVKIGLAKPLK